MRSSRAARLLMCLAAAVGAGIVMGVALTILDLYITGHGHASLGSRWLELGSVGVHLSRADVLLLAAVLLAAVFTWRQSAGNRG